MIDLHSILLKIERLKSLVDKQDIPELDWMAKVVQNYEALMVMKDNPAVANLVGSFRKENAQIYHQLNNQRIMSQEERNYLFAKREANERFISLLGSDPVNLIENIAQRIDNYTNQLK